MKRIIFILGFLTLSALPLWGQGCGADCGNVGDPYEGGAVHVPCAGDCPITACGVLAPTGAPTYYVLQNDIGGDATADCLTMSYPSGSFNLDLAGHTVTGLIHLITNKFSGSTVFNGTVACNTTTAGHGCIYLNSTGTPTAQGRVHHLTPHNTAIGRNISLVWQPVSNAIAYALRVDHITSTTEANASADRPYNIWVDGGQKLTVQADHNDLTCPGNSAQCQGVALYTCPGSLVTENQIVLGHPTYDTGLYDTARGILLDSEGKANSTGSVASLNLITADANRCVRVRKETAVVIQQNSFLNIRLGGRSACVYLGNEDTTAETSSTTVNNNTFEINDGNGVVVTGTTNDSASIHDNTVSCFLADCSAAGYFARTDATFATADGGGGDIFLNTVAVLTAAGKNAVMVCGPAGNPSYVCTQAARTSAVTYCTTGTVVGNGVATLDNTLCGGGGGGLPAVGLAPEGLSFDSRLVGSTSATQAVTLTNVGTGLLTITSIAVGADYSQTNDCGANLAASAFCTIDLAFAPTHKGAPLTGSLTVTTDAASSPDVMTFDANSFAPAALGTARIIGTGAIR